MACDAQSLINAAYSNGYSKLSERDLMECIVAAACAFTPGGGGAGQQVFSGHGVPAVVPVVTSAVYYDLDTGIIYQWTGIAWV